MRSASVVMVASVAPRRFGGVTIRLSPFEDRARATRVATRRPPARPRPRCDATGSRLPEAGRTVPTLTPAPAWTPCDVSDDLPGDAPPPRRARADAGRARRRGPRSWCPWSSGSPSVRSTCCSSTSCPTPSPTSPTPPPPGRWSPSASVGPTGSAAAGGRPLAGTLTLLLAVEGYYATAVLALGDDPSTLTNSAALLWLALAVGAGVVFGTAGAWARIGPAVARAGGHGRGGRRAAGRGLAGPRARSRAPATTPPTGRTWCRPRSSCSCWRCSARCWRDGPPGSGSSGRSSRCRWPWPGRWPPGRSGAAGLLRRGGRRARPEYAARAAPVDARREHAERTAADRPTIFTTTWCGYCKRLKSQLDRAGVAYDEVNIEEVPDGAALVAEGQRRQRDGADGVVRRRLHPDEPLREAGPGQAGVSLGPWAGLRAVVLDVDGTAARLGRRDRGRVPARARVRGRHPARRRHAALRPRTAAGRAAARRSACRPDRLTEAARRVPHVLPARRPAPGDARTTGSSTC